MTQLDTLAWYAVQVVSGREIAASTILTGRHEIATLVLIETAIRKFNHHSKRRRVVEVPMLPGYVLAGLDPVAPQWHELLKPKVVEGVVGMGGQPARIRWRQIDRLLRRCGASVDGQVARAHRAANVWQQGDRAEIVDGLYAGVVVTVERIRNRRTADVLYDLVGGGKGSLNLPLDLLDVA